MLFYYNQTTDKNGLVYSLDMVRLTFELPSDDNARQSIIDYFRTSTRPEIEVSPPSFVPFKYRYMVTIDYGPSKAVLGFCFNGTNRDETLSCFLEFNPNKIGCVPEFRSDLDFLWITSGVRWSLSRFDLAVDIPIAKENVHLKKDGRMFSVVSHSAANCTEYLGKRSNDGFCKLYNKAIESGLPFAEGLTRFELTSAQVNPRHVLEQFPTVYALNPQLSFRFDDELTQNEKVLVELLGASDNPSTYLSHLTYRKRKKIEPYLFAEDKALTFDFACVGTILNQVNSYVNGTY